MSHEHPEQDHPQYVVAHLHRALAEDPRTAEQGVRVTIRGTDVYLTGEVASAARRDALTLVVQEQLPDVTVHNDVHVVDSRDPGTSVEELR
ncbi:MULTISPECIES: BON domain-containing protein [Rhodococcus]|uniref:BON domain-containing protein n=1 Tax=Rhodococcus aetherivorans TaxID=191292 RepID=A0AA46PN29_9NOCA|nr:MULTISPECIES: BON domain-containing protein [Rhodococcus]AKE88596.1 phospholipid-binding protein [Rhodococcus aetherivorans]QIX48895.1 BON domain-containing protein [Rhodococcus sp. DMU1]QRI76055.1 BON domain-containing protein [Rhodococcus aetherivorans]QSE59466.1 BON domain-containing protein [Rhodococcus sp. PSBB066]QSE69209.1 BON domain-containing protein [Rhodococcus sp. PSBB049]